VSRIRTRAIATAVTTVALLAGGVALASPASATPAYGITIDWQVLTGSTWTTISLAGTYGTGSTHVPAGDQPSRIVITNIGSNDATLSNGYTGATDYNSPTTGISLDDCDGHTGDPLPLSAPIPLAGNGGSVTCTGTYNFQSGAGAVLYGYTAQYPAGIGQDDFGNQGVYYYGIDDAAEESLQASDGSGTLISTSAPGLQTLPAGYLPHASFAFTNPDATEDLTDVHYTSTGTASIADACPSLSTVFDATSHTGSGTCVVDLAKPATTTPQTVTVTATGTGSFGDVVTTQSFTYAATPAACSLSATAFTAGDSGTLDCTGFEPDTNVTLTLHSAATALATVNTGTGDFTGNFTIPTSTVAGTHTISVDLGSTALLTADPITVAAAAGGTGSGTGSDGTSGGLAFTGTDVRTPLGAAGALLLAGLGMLLYRRRRTAR
jgi:hypothetical protein